jgi:hypothetical protein
MTKQAVLDLYFAEARSKLIDLAAFLDRIERAGGEGDFRLESFRAGLREIAAGDGPDHARQLLTLLSDPTTEPVPAASIKSAAGAWPGFQSSSHPGESVPPRPAIG